MYKNEIENHELFTRVKAEIRGAENYLIVGIDVGKLSHHAFFGMPTGRVLFILNTTLN